MSVFMKRDVVHPVRRAFLLLIFGVLEKRLHESSEIFVEHMPPAVSCVAAIQFRTQDEKTVSREIDKVGTIYLPIHQVTTTLIAVHLVRRAQI